MEEFDLIVLGSGAGMNVASNALQYDMKVAVVEHDLLGGTCLNNGCIPTKILLYPADVIRALTEAKSIGVTGLITGVDFRKVMGRMRSFVGEGRGEMEQGIKAMEESSDRLRWFRGTGEFVGDHTMKIGEDTIKAPKIVIAAGSRPLVPPIEGIREIGYLDNVSVLDLEELPESLVILGGGYIACEYGHFFSALGTRVTIIGRNPRLLKNEEPEISAIVKRRFSEYVKIYTDFEAFKVLRDGDRKVVFARDSKSGKAYKIRADEIMLATGRRSNADLFKPEMTGVETDGHGWIKVNEYLETTGPGIWALGDALGIHLYRHTANYEAEVVWSNGFTEEKVKVDYHAVPHAVFGYPQVAGVGLTESQAKAAGYKILVGKAKYTDVTKGYAMGEDDSLVKVIAEQGTMKILGCHIAGSEAALLVQPIVYLMNTGNQDYMPLATSQVIHPALSEVVANAFGNLRPPEGDHDRSHAHGQNHSDDHTHSNEHSHSHDHHSG